MVSLHESFQFAEQESCLVLHWMQHNVPHGHSATDNAASLSQLKLITWLQEKRMQYLKIWTLQSEKSLLGHCKKLRDRTQEHLLRVSLCLPGSAWHVDLFPACLDHFISIEVSTYPKKVPLWSLGCSALHLSLEFVWLLVCVTADNLGISQQGTGGAGAPSMREQYHALNVLLGLQDKPCTGFSKSEGPCKKWVK